MDEPKKYFASCCAFSIVIVVVVVAVALSVYCLFGWLNGLFVWLRIASKKRLDNNSIQFFFIRYFSTSHFSFRKRKKKNHFEKLQTDNCILLPSISHSHFCVETAFKSNVQFGLFDFHCLPRSLPLCRCCCCCCFCLPFLNS